MQEFSQKLMRLNDSGQTSSVPTAIFGSASQLARSLDFSGGTRIGMWPCISKEAPEAAMGLMSVLAMILEQWRDITVYRVFARLEGSPETYTWSLDKSQFSVDDWEFDGLNDNVGIWGDLTRIDDERWQFTLEIEDDFSEDEELTSLEYMAHNLNALVNQLPSIADDIAQHIGVNAFRTSSARYEEEERSENALKPLLQRAFEFERDLYLHLWGQKRDMGAAHQALIDAGTALNDSFAAWMVAISTARALLPGFENIHDQLVAEDQIIKSFEQHAVSAIIIGQRMFDNSEVQIAFKILESNVEKHPENTSAWRALTNAYRRGGRITAAVDAYQRAIGQGAADVRLYTQYAEYLPLIQAQGWEVEAFELIDPDDLDEDFESWEAVEAYRRALNLSPKNPAEIYARMILLLLEIDEDDQFIWDDFEKLVANDASGEQVRSVVDEFYNVEDLDPAINIVKNAHEASPDRVDLMVNLAVLYLNDEQEEQAALLLDQAYDLTDDENVQDDIDRLMLSAEDSDFEVRMGEIADKTSANSSLSDDEVEFLEDVIESAPSFGEAYIHLAQAYLSWDDPSAALETLLDATKNSVDDPDVLELLAQVLWMSNERELAFTYLNKGIRDYPNHVPLLAFTGQSLFEDEQPDLAKVYLGRAEMLSPRHPALAKAREHIARLLSE